MTSSHCYASHHHCLKTIETISTYQPILLIEDYRYDSYVSYQHCLKTIKSATEPGRYNTEKLKVFTFK